MGEIATLEFFGVDEPIRGLVTKFGGQPVWYSEPEWPISPELKIPMQFICQIKLEERLFGQTVGRMAYIFMTRDPENRLNVWDPEGGENAVIIQPGSQEAVCEPITNGPTLFCVETRIEQEKGWLGVRDEYVDVEVPCEFGVELTYEEEDEAEAKGYGHRTKLGGRAGFLQSEDWPFGRPTPLLLQLHASDLPFNGQEIVGAFGDALYAFISDDGSVGRMLCQST